MSESALQNAVSRLESVAARLESVALSSPSGSGGDSGAMAASVTGFDGLMAGNFAKYLSLSSTIGGDVQTQAAMVDKAFKAERQFLDMASKSKAPAPAKLGEVILPIGKNLMAIQEYREQQRRSELFNYLSTISESIGALSWVVVTPAPAPHVKEMKDAGMFYSNRVLKDCKEKPDAQTHTDWVKAWLGTLVDLQDYVKQYHTTGVAWNPKGQEATAAAASPAAAGGAPPPPPPPPPGPPPPPTPPASSGSGADSSEGHSALFDAINKGTTVTTGLRKVTDDMKTHKNPGLRQGPAPFKAAATKPVTAPKPKVGSAPKTAPSHPPLTELQGKKWVVEYHDNSNVLLDDTEIKQTVYVYKCVNTVIQVKSKVNSIVLDSCKKTSVVFEEVVAALEFINCQSVKGQVTGKVPTISIDKTDGCMVYLSKDALKAEIVSAKSSEMNILVPAGDGDYKEFALPEQFKSTWDGKSMVTIQSDI